MKKYVLSFLMIVICLMTMSGVNAAISPTENVIPDWNIANWSSEVSQETIDLNMDVGETHDFGGYGMYVNYSDEYFEKICTHEYGVKLKAIKPGNTTITAIRYIMVRLSSAATIKYNIHIS